MKKFNKPRRRKKPIRKIKDSGIKIKDILKESNASILEFIRFEVGEGIEVEKVDFASEVMSQIES